jgi:hypothetical protein
VAKQPWIRPQGHSFLFTLGSEYRDSWLEVPLNSKHETDDCLEGSSSRAIKEQKYVTGRSDLETEINFDI